MVKNLILWIDTKKCFFYNSAIHQKRKISYVEIIEQEMYTE